MKKINPVLATLVLLAWLAVGLGALLEPTVAADGRTSVLDKAGKFEVYLPDQQTAVWRSGISAVDSVDLASQSTITTFTIGRCPTLAVSPRMTASSGTATVRVAFYYKVNTTYYLLGVDTASQFTCNVETEAGVYTDETFLFDTFGATHALVLVSGAPSAGTLDLWVGSY